jgi:hypothetical protein
MGLFSTEEPTQYEIDGTKLVCMFCKMIAFIPAKNNCTAQLEQGSIRNGQIKQLFLLYAAVAAIFIGLCDKLLLFNRCYPPGIAIEVGNACTAAIILIGRRHNTLSVQVKSLYISSIAIVNVNK